MHGLVVIEGMNLSGHPWIINEMYVIQKLQGRSKTKMKNLQIHIRLIHML